MLDGVRFRGWGHGGDTFFLCVHVYSSYDRIRYVIWFRKIRLFFRPQLLHNNREKALRKPMLPLISLLLMLNPSLF